MLEKESNKIDPSAFSILLLLSNGQRYTISDFIHLTSTPLVDVERILNILESDNFIKNQENEYEISVEGLDYLATRGVNAVSATNKKVKHEDYAKITLPFFTSFNEFFIWIATPLILLIPAFAFASASAAGYSFVSLDKKIAQISIWVFYFAIVILYVWLSHHHVMENERLVIFRGGKAIGKKGPGLVFILPLIDNPKKVDIRERSQELKDEACLTQDHILINTSFYMSWHIDDPIQSLTKVNKLDDAMLLLSTAILRATISEITIKSALEKPREINTLIRSRIEQKVSDWGVRIDNTELNKLQPPDSLVKQIESRLKSKLAVETEIENSDAQLRILRDLITLKEGLIRTGDNTSIFNLYTAISKQTNFNSIVTSNEKTSKSALEYLARNPNHTLFHIEITLQGLISIQDFYHETEYVLKAIDTLYSIFAILYNNNENASEDLFYLLQSKKSHQLKDISNIEIQEILFKYDPPSLFISTLKYASPFNMDLLGIGPIIKEVNEVIKDAKWRGKHEKQSAELEIKEKETDLEQKQILNILERIERVKKLKLSKKQEELLLATILPQTSTIANSKINPQFVFTKEVNIPLLPENIDKSAEQYLLDSE